MRFTVPASIQRVIAAKISDDRLSLRPRTPRTADALNCFGNSAKTLFQLIRLARFLEPPERDRVVPEREPAARATRLDSCRFNPRSSVSFDRTSCRMRLNSRRAWFVSWSIELKRLDFPLGIFPSELDWHDIPHDECAYGNLGLHSSHLGREGNIGVLKP